MIDQPTSRLDLEDLEAIRHRADNATEGPWGVERYGEETLAIHSYPTSQAVAVAGSEQAGTSVRADAEFLAAAREDVPTLLAEVWRLTSRVHELEIEVGNAHGSEATTAAHRDQLQEQVDQLRTQLRTAALPDTEEGWVGVDWRHLLLAEITGEDRDDIDPGDPNAWHRAYAIWCMQPDKTDPPTREELRKETR